MTPRQLLFGTLVVLAAAGAVAALGPAGAAESAAASSPTYVGSDVTTDTTWTAEDGPYFVEEDLTVAEGATLTIESGTRVNAGEEVTLTVEGSLLANGSAGDPVQFTTADPASGAGTWETIEYAGDGDSTLRLAHAVLEHAETGVTVTSPAGSIRILDSTVREHVRDGIGVRTREGSPSLRIADSRFADVGRAGVVFAAPATDPYVDTVDHVRIARTTFSNTGANGVLVRAREISSVALTEVTVTDVSGDGVAFATESTDARPESTNGDVAEDVTLRRVAVENVGGDGVAFRGGALDDVDVVGGDVRSADGHGVHVEGATDADRVRVADTTVVDSQSGFRLSLRRTTGGIQRVTVAVEGNDFSRNDAYGVRATAEYVFVDAFDVRNNTLADNGAGGFAVGTQQIDNTVFADNVVRANGGTGVELSAVRVRGVTALRNRIVGNAEHGVSVRASDLLGGVDVGHNDVFDNADFGVAVEGSRAASGSTLHNNTVAGNGDGVRVAGPTPTRLANNSVVLNTADRERDGGGAASATGVLVENAPNVELLHNDVYGHLVGLRSDTDGTVVAEQNYWGAASGPYHETLNPGGAGDAVLTDRGKADPVPYASEPFGPRYERPTAVLEANETTVAPGEAVQFSAAQSVDDGAIATYYFTVAGEERRGPEPTRVASFPDPGTYEVSLAVEDEMGVRSLNDATVNVTVQEARQTTAAPTTTTPETTTATTATTAGGQQERDDSLLGSLLSLWGGLGVLFYGAALALGGYGTWLSLGGRDPPVGGTTIHALAAVGVLTWAAAGLFGDSTLLTFAGAGAVGWGSATAAIVAVAAG